MKILIVMDPSKGQPYLHGDVNIQGQFGYTLPGAPSQDGRRIYVLDVDAAFEIEGA